MFIYIYDEELNILNPKISRERGRDTWEREGREFWRELKEKKEERVEMEEDIKELAWIHHDYARTSDDKGLR